MLEIEEKELVINKELKRKIEIICRFCNAKLLSLMVVSEI